MDTTAQQSAELSDVDGRLVESCQLCSVCQTIDFERLRSVVSTVPSADSGREVVVTTPDNHWIRLATTEERLSCTFCAFLKDVAEVENAKRKRPLKICDCKLNIVSDPFRVRLDEHLWIESRILSVLWSEIKIRISVQLQTCQAVQEGLSHGNNGLEYGKESRVLFGGRKRPATLDIDIIKGWIDTCETEHVGTCKKSHIRNRESKMPLIRFINVQDDCIDEFSLNNPFEHTYTALSYVWGEGENTKTRLALDNVSILTKPGGLGKVEVSKTIRDAITLTRSLGLRYLWVDALCIIQDSVSDKEAQLSNMSSIFARSFVTIAAAHGTDADAGLAGISPDTRTTQYEFKAVSDRTVLSEDGNEEFVPGLSLVSVLDPGNTLSRSMDILQHEPWNYRGWTLQEHILSRRLLVFTKEVVYWNCSAASFSEESYFNRMTPWQGTQAYSGSLLSAKTLGYKIETSNTRDLLSAYYQLVEDYSHRYLTFPGDIYDGFKAITDTFSQYMGCDILWGLPQESFELSLLWRSKYRGGSLSRRHVISSLPMTNLHMKVPFPSWSWMGWQGPVSMPGTVSADTGERPSGRFVPVVKCYRHLCSPLRFSPVCNKADYGVGSHTGPERTDEQFIDISVVRRENPGLVERLETIPESHILFLYAQCVQINIPEPKHQWTSKVTGKLDDRTIDVELDGFYLGHGIQDFIIVAKERKTELEGVNTERPRRYAALQLKWHDVYAEVAHRATLIDFEPNEFDLPYKLIALQ